MLVNSYVSLLLDAFSLAPDFKISLRFPSERRFLSKTEEQPIRQFKTPNLTLLLLRILRVNLW